ncbi:chloride channel protein [Rufibacter quisquiliarum]|uniref:CIC family chloride channel protein n=1 Tax=Rufibacter quisquiliarum TaxID=1549639 RepID=A0A839GVF4_9BACT|nr:chloride channel protein [Rufibacter quisquiliarum]MBA9077751.1 CIC family chloride channel protein [Rufibacter quisquiliarum]
MRKSRAESPFYRAGRAAVIWLQRKLPRTQLLLVFSVLVGITAGLAAVILKNLVHAIRELVLTNRPSYFQNQIYLLLPMMGILLTVLVIRVFFRNRFERGVARVLVAISRRSSKLRRSQMFSHVLTSGITVGFGGSAGLESPIVVTGAAIGSNMGKAPFFSYKERTVLLACGAAAGIAAVFNAPVAGLLFALEILLTDVTISAFIPLILASVSGVLCSTILMREEVLFSFRSLQPFDYHNLPYFLLLGIFCGLVSVYYAQVTLKVESLFHRMGEESRFTKALIGGAILGLLIFIFPPLFGEGYESIKALSQGQLHTLFQPELYEQMQDNRWFVLFFVGAIALVKVVATSVTLAGGGNGGNFAPSLFVGGYVGFFFSRLVNMVSSVRLPEDNFTVVGMAGILAGVMYAPLTGVFLIAEITNGYDLIVPLMVVAATSYALVRWFEQFPMDTRELAKKGQILTQNRDLNILRSISLEQLIERNFHELSPQTSLGKIVEAVTHTKRSLFPVVSPEDKHLQGIILLDDLKEVMFKPELYDQLTARQLMKLPPEFVDMHEEMPSVMHKFDHTGAWNLPVVDQGQYVGFVSKSGVFMAYRRFLLMQSEK